MPATAHLINGKVKDIFGNALAGATVELTHSSITPVLSATTDPTGTYIINLAKLDSQWSKGQEFDIKGSKTAEGKKTETVIISGTGGQTVNITLEEVSDFVYDPPPQDRTNLTQTIPLHYDGEKITRQRPFPVMNENVTDKYRPADDDDNGNPEYYGFTDRFGNWYIEKFDSDNGSHRYARGSSDYITNWNNRTDLGYNYFHDVF